MIVIAITPVGGVEVMDLSQPTTGVRGFDLLESLWEGMDPPHDLIPIGGLDPSLISVEDLDLVQDLISIGDPDLHPAKNVGVNMAINAKSVVPET